MGVIIFHQNWRRTSFTGIYIIVHSDREGQYLSDKMKELVQTFGLKQSDRRTAWVESMIHTIMLSQNHYGVGWKQSDRRTVGNAKRWLWKPRNFEKYLVWIYRRILQSTAITFKFELWISRWVWNTMVWEKQLKSVNI